MQIDSDAVYRAVRDCFNYMIQCGTIEQVVRDAVAEQMLYFIQSGGMEPRPYEVCRPTMTKDGDAWLCILGDLPTGIVGCGASPAEAAYEFDKEWNKKATCAAQRGDKEGADG